MDIPFAISARTAHLIGLENFANAEGAIVELVKNPNKYAIMIIAVVLVVLTILIVLILLIKKVVTKLVHKVRKR